MLWWGEGMGVALITLPGLLSVFQVDAERNHVPVLQPFQRIPGQEAIGRNVAARWTKGSSDCRAGARTAPLWHQRAPKCFLLFSWSAELEQMTWKQGATSEELPRQAWPCGRRDDSKSGLKTGRRQLGGGWGGAKIQLCCRLSGFWGALLQHAETFECNRGLSAKLRHTQDSEKWRPNRNYWKMTNAALRKRKITVATSFRNESLSPFQTSCFCSLP